MSVAIIREKLASYAPETYQEEENALKEICQEIALGALARTDFFKVAAFQGGTCLRILHGLNRFSEDLDFILKKSKPQFSWQGYFKEMKAEFEAFGISFEIKEPEREGDTIQKIFLKEDSLGKILLLKDRPHGGKRKLIRIKFELDTHPPAGGIDEIRYGDFPFPYAVTVQDLPTLFAGKNHALLCRDYVKGRDWYDFLWYVQKKVPINFRFLSNACDQQGPWQGKQIQVDKKWYLNAMKEKMTSLDWKQAREDVIRFLKPGDQKSLELWSREFFLDRLEKLASYL